MAVVANPRMYIKGMAENQPGHRKVGSYNLPEWVRHPLKAEPKKVAILFPGEQNHSMGMLRDARNQPTPEVSALLEAAKMTLGYDVLETIKAGPAAKLSQTGVNQPIMYVANCIAYEKLKERHPDIAEHPQACAGYSVGELSALYAAGVITFEQGLEIVKVRAEAMQELADEVPMEALVIHGVPEDKVEAAARRAEKQDRDASDPEVYVARRWCPEGVVCAGKRSTVLKLLEISKTELGKAKEVRLLDDHIHAGHTPMAATVAERVHNVLNRMIPAMRPPRCELYLNATGWRIPAGTSPFAFADALKNHLTSPLLWDSCVDQMMRWGIKEFFEVGPNRSLSQMLRNHECVFEAPYEVIRPSNFCTNIQV